MTSFVLFWSLSRVLRADLCSCAAARWPGFAASPPARSENNLSWDLGFPWREERGPPPHTHHGRLSNVWLELNLLSIWQALGHVGVIPCLWQALWDGGGVTFQALELPQSHTSPFLPFGLWHLLMGPLVSTAFPGA